MARNIKCKICGKQTTTEIAYKVEHISSSGKKTNKYYCSKEEYEEDKVEKESYNKIQLLVDSMLNYTCINNQKNKMITSLYNIGYSKKHILICMEYYADSITFYLEKKNIDNEYQKLRYIFSVIENNIKDFVANDKSKSVNKVNLEEEIIQDEVETEIEIVSQPKNKRRSLKDRLKGV